MAQRAASPYLQTLNLRPARVTEPWLVATLVLLDMVAVWAGLALAHTIGFRTTLAEIEALPAPDYYLYYIFAAVLTPAWVLVLAMMGLYRVDLADSREYGRVATGSTLGLVMMIFASLVQPDFIFGRIWLLATWGATTALLLADRMMIRIIVQGLRARGHLLRPAVVVGANPEGVAVASQVNSGPGSSLRVIGFLDDNLPADTEIVPGLRVLGGIDLLNILADRRQVCDAILISTALPREQLLGLFKRFGTSDRLSLRLSSGLYELITTGVTVQEFGHVPLLTIERTRLQGLDAFLKGVLDRVVAAALLLLLSPVFLAIACWVKRDSPGPAIYRRHVLGIGGHEFDAFKFRTMVQNADAVLLQNADLRREFEANFKLADDPRITRAGRFLRRLSLDELPQLANVLRGEMSLVGPRMITPEEHQRYGQSGTNLLTVKPGLTGLWQVSGRADLSYDERVTLDMYYIRNYSIWLDVRLLFETVGAVLRGSGAY